MRQPSPDRYLLAKHIGVNTTTHSIQGILFDKDGTLIDFNKTWLPRYWAAAEHLARHCNNSQVAEQLMTLGGYQVATQTWQPDCLLASGSNDQIMTAWANHLDITLDATVRSECLAYFANSEQPYVAVLNDMDAFFTSLRAKSIHLGVATMDDYATAQSTLDAMQLRHYFDFVCGADSGYGLKPEAGMALAFCDATGLLPERIMMVGDSPRDLVMGRNAGVGLCIGVLTGAHTRDALAPEADYVFEDIAAIAELLA